MGRVFNLRVAFINIPALKCGVYWRTVLNRVINWEVN